MAIANADAAAPAKNRFFISIPPCPKPVAVLAGAGVSGAWLAEPARGGNHVASSSLTLVQKPDKRSQIKSPELCNLKIILIRMNKKSEIEELKKEAANQGMVVDSAAEMRAGVVLESCDIFKGCNEIIILHAGEQYRLRITRAGKLILNK